MIQDNRKVINRIRNSVCVILCLVTIIMMISKDHPIITYAASNVETPTLNVTTGFNESYYCVTYGETLQLKISGSSKINYRVENETIASIESNGTIKGLKQGRTHLYATVGKKTYQCVLAVLIPRLSAEEYEFVINQEKQVVVTLKDRKATEKITVSVVQTDIATAKVKNYKGDKATIVVTPKKDGNTTLIIGRTHSLEQIRIDITAREITELTAIDIYKKCSKGMVEIVTKDSAGEANLGSGFFISQDKILTNYHVIKGAKEISVVDYNDKKITVLNLWDYDETLDLALLGVEAEHEYLGVSYENYGIGDRIYTIGSPYGLTGTFSTGIISMTLRIMELEGIYYTQITAPISKGSSGGPLINRFGNVIGINTFTRADGQNLNFAVPSTYFLELDNSIPTDIQLFYEQNS